MRKFRVIQLAICRLHLEYLIVRICFSRLGSRLFCSGLVSLARADVLGYQLKVHLVSLDRMNSSQQGI